MSRKDRLQSPAAHRRWKMKYRKRHNYRRLGMKRGIKVFSVSEKRMILLSPARDVEIARRMETSIDSIQVTRSHLRRFAQDTTKALEDRCKKLGLSPDEIESVLTYKNHRYTAT